MKRREYPIYRELTDAYDFYNKHLFENKLPRCMITLSRRTNYMGLFMPNSYISTNEDKLLLHEINMNTEYFAIRKIEMTLGTLVHEMCHLKTHKDGTSGRTCYHNKEWASIMKGVGLIPSDTGLEGGKETGQTVSHYIEKGGMFERKTKELLKQGYLLSFVAKLYSEVKSYTIDEAKLMVVPGKKNHFKDEEGKEIVGKSVRYGKDEEGKEIIKIVLEKKKTWVRSKYTCKCNNYVILAKPNLDLTCNVCKEKIREEKGYK